MKIVAITVVSGCEQREWTIRDLRRGAAAPGGGEDDGMGKNSASGWALHTSPKYRLNRRRMKTRSQARIIHRFLLWRACIASRRNR